MTVADTDALTRRQRWTLTLVATFTMSISYVDRQAFAVLAPLFRQDLGVGDLQYGLLASAFSLAYLLGAPIAGAWIDRLGARRALPRAVLGWSAVAALHALAPGFAALFALRVALGLSESPSFPGAAQTVHRVMPPPERPRALGVLFTGSSVGAMIAPPLALGLASAFGWRAAFLGTALVGALWLPVWWAATRAPAARAAMDARGEAQTLAPQADPTDGVPFRDAPMRATHERAAWRHPAVWRAFVVVFASAPALAFVLLWFPLFASDVFRTPVTELRWFLAAPPLAFDVGAIVFGDLASRAAWRGEGRTRKLVAVASVMTASLLALPLSATPWHATLVASITMFGGGGVYALATAEMLSRVPSSRVSAAGGLAAAAQSLAYIAANPLIAVATQRSGSYTAAVIALGLWVIPGALAWFLWPRAPRSAP